MFFVLFYFNLYVFIVVSVAYALRPGSFNFTSSQRPLQGLTTPTSSLLRRFLAVFFY